MNTDNTKTNLNFLSLSVFICVHLWLILGFRYRNRGRTRKGEAAGGWHRPLSRVCTRSRCRSRADARRASLAGPNTNAVRQIEDENLAVADLPGLGSAGRM